VSLDEDTWGQPLVGEGDMPGVAVSRSTLHDLPKGHPLEGRGSIRYWAGLLLPAIGWFYGLSSAYMLVERACVRDGWRWSPALVTGAWLVVVIAGGLLSWANLARVGRRAGTQHPLMEGRARLMAILGVAGALLFGALLVAQLLSTVVIGPCMGA
jgi:hypothetical protein